MQKETRTVVYDDELRLETKEFSKNNLDNSYDNARMR